MKILVLNYNSKTEEEIVQVNISNKKQNKGEQKITPIYPGSAIHCFSTETYSHQKQWIS